MLAACLSSMLFVSSSLICLCSSACLSYCSNSILLCAAAICADFSNAWFAFAVSNAASTLISFTPSTSCEPIVPASCTASTKFVYNICYQLVLASSPTSFKLAFVSAILSFKAFIVVGSPSPNIDCSQANCAACMPN